MGLVTVFCPLTTTGVIELVIQTGNSRSVVDWRVNPVGSVGHDRITLAPAGMIVSCGGGKLGSVVLFKPGAYNGPETFYAIAGPET
jgi:hypothetical protein